MIETGSCLEKLADFTRVIPSLGNVHDVGELTGNVRESECLRPHLALVRISNNIARDYSPHERRRYL
jgi:hypothetical protein